MAVGSFGATVDYIDVILKQYEARASQRSLRRKVRYHHGMNALNTVRKRQFKDVNCFFFAYRPVVEWEIKSQHFLSPYWIGSAI